MTRVQTCALPIYLEQLASGFSNASGLATDDQGHLFFADAAMHKIYRWNAETKQAELLTDQVASPQAVGFVAPHTLLAIDLSKAVFSVDPQTGAVAKIPPAQTPQDGTDLLLPVGFHTAWTRWCARWSGGASCMLRAAIWPSLRM